MAGSEACQGKRNFLAKQKACARNDLWFIVTICDYKMLKWRHHPNYSRKLPIFRAIFESFIRDKESTCTLQRE